MQTDLFDRVKLHGLGGTFVYTIYVRLMWQVQHRGFPCSEGRDVKVGTAKRVQVLFPRTSTNRSAPCLCDCLFLSNKDGPSRTGAIPSTPSLFSQRRLCGCLVSSRKLGPIEKARSHLCLCLLSQSGLCGCRGSVEQSCPPRKRVNPSNKRDPTRALPAQSKWTV